MTNESFARRRLAECCHLLYDRHLTVSAGGNMSVRLGEDEILITPSGVNKGLISGDDLVKMDMDGNVISGGKPSIEHKFHIGIYKENPETNAVIHCHPLYCLALAVKGEDIKSCLTPEGVLLLDQVPTVRYETPGSQELVDAVMEYADAPAMLMAKHGAITQGRTLEEAFNRMEELEFQAHLQILAGDAAELPVEEVVKLRGMR
ncbi:class II aldolase/adducin family protein [Methanomethylophilus alvi]|jgi:L-fuculose-phosphate aldolase|uniref:class II aldolase/adducin family protein n=1 Tax=Methanomethylophilus alvi TaxID=1291540 RepID=UPI00033837FB|nr:class II aldolase/adducin family protein [Methanomethylophilus alvi]MDD7480075.1 class II aldolase/adducin family protein [Methanomethylophilus alvi]MDY7059918.1 class II aldolase/adducin family protein [Methanomethylophilus alvi]CDF31235.1 mreB/Mrl family Cell shape determining protein [Methanoculleus sp. CAG:1088]